MSARRWSVGAGVCGLLVAALVGCSGDEPSQRAVPSPSPTTTTEPAVPPVAPELSVPATTAGDLDSKSVPGPLDLGRGWSRYVDPGAPEEGYVGNGSWVRARGTDEVVQAVVPLGCSGLTTPPALPVPEHALEATYRGPGDAPGVALVLDYDDPDRAADFVAGMGRVARSCPAPAGPVPSDGPLVASIEPARVDASTVLQRRREFGAGATDWTWSEAVVRRGARVGLLIVATDAGAAPDLGDLAARLRAAVIR